MTASATGQKSYAGALSCLLASTVAFQATLELLFEHRLDNDRSRGVSNDGSPALR